MENRRAAILAEFTDKLNEFGPDSREIREFRALHESDKELAKLFQTAVRVQSQFRQGQLSTEQDNAGARKSGSVGARVAAKHST